MEVCRTCHDSSLAKAAQDQQVGNKPDSSASQSLGSNASEGERVSLTSRAGELQALEEKIAELPVVDTQRVQAVQRSLASGSFQVDPAKVAEKLISFESTLGGGES